MTLAKMKNGVKLPSYCSTPPATSSMSMPQLPPTRPPSHLKARMGQGGRRYGLGEAAALNGYRSLMR
jgi:hypothetical protein